MTDERQKPDFRKRAIDNHILHPETQMMGYGYDPMLSEASLKPPVFLTSTFIFKSAQHGKDFFDYFSGRKSPKEGEEAGLIYSRFNNPDLEVLEDRLALWEEAEKGLVFASGMGAITAVLFTYLRPGDVVVHSSPLYGATETMMLNLLPQFGIKAVGFMCGTGRKGIDEAIEKGAAEGPIKLFFAETPANPTNGLVDLEYLAKRARECRDQDGNRALVAVDNTFLGPVNQHPLKLGCDIVMYSLTKYVGGHSDLVAGGVVGSKAVVEPVLQTRSNFGMQLDPHSGWMVMRSLETLKIRVERAIDNARIIAKYLDDHPKVRKVHFLDFLPKDEEDYRIYQNQCEAPGSTFSFEVDGGEAEAFRVLDGLQVIKLAVSLGGTETLISHPASTTHSGVPKDVRDRLGINDALIRISVGIEHPDDLIADLKHALDKI